MSEMKKRGKMTVSELAWLLRSLAGEAYTALQLDEGGDGILSVIASLGHGGDTTRLYITSSDFELRPIDRLKVLVSGRLSHTVAIKAASSLEIEATADRWQVKGPQLLQRLGF